MTLIKREEVNVSNVHEAHIICRGLQRLKEEIFVFRKFGGGFFLVGIVAIAIAIESSKSSQNKERKITKQLRDKDVFYLNSDKDNKSAIKWILNKRDYYDNLIKHGPYVEISRNLLSRF